MIEKILVGLENLTSFRVLVILSIVGLLVFGNTFFNKLFWDDYDSIVNNAYIRDWKYFPKFFSENLTAGSGIRDNYWRPLLLVSFSIDYRVGGLSPFVYHLQNLLWHVLSAWLVYLLILIFFEKKIYALFAGLIFLVHPLQVEAVTYVAGRADPMHAAMLLLSFLFFHQFARRKMGRFGYLASLAFFIGALLTKERAIIFPGILLVYLIIIYRKKALKETKKILLFLLPYFLLAAIYLFLRLTVLHFAETFDWGRPNNIGAKNWVEYLMAYFQGIAVYAGLLVWPARLYMEKTLIIPNSFWSFQVLVGAGLVFASLILMIFSLFHKKELFFGLAWFWISFSPSFHIYPIQGLLYEHWLYFPIIGLLLVFTLMFHKLFQLTKSKNTKLLFLVFSLIIILLFSIRTIFRNRDWNNPIRFYEKNIALGGVSARVYNNLGMAYSDEKKYKEAIDAYQKAIDLESNLFQPWYNMGNEYRKINEKEKAVQSYLKAIELNPYFLSAYYNLAMIYFDDDNHENAIDILKKAEIIKPDAYETLLYLGLAYADQKDKEKAEQYLRKALSLDPANLELMKIIESL